MIVALLLDVEAASRVRYGNYTSRYLHVIHLLIAVLQAFAVQERCHRNKQCPCTKQTARESTEYIYFLLLLYIYTSTRIELARIKNAEQKLRA
jgi:hypothetical protein